MRDDGFGNPVGYCPKHRAGWYAHTACPVCQGDLEKAEAQSERRKNLISLLDGEQSVLAMLLRECLELMDNPRISYEPGINWLKGRVQTHLSQLARQPLLDARCPETGFMDGTGQCCLSVGHAGDHKIDGSHQDMGDSVAPLGMP